MKRYIVSAIGISILALAVGSEPAVAGEFEVPALKKERKAAPARRAPARQAERPAPRQQPAQQQPARQQPARQQPAQPQTQQASNWTGSQAGGHGGGNSGAGTFADPIASPFISPLHTACCGTYVLSPSVANQGPPFSFSYRDTSFAGGAFYNYSVQTGLWVWRVEVDFSGQNTESSATQTTIANVPYGTVSGGTFFPAASAEQTTTLTGSVKQGWDGTLRGTIGGLINPWNMIFVTGGVAVGHWSGSYSARVTTHYCGAVVASGSCPSGSVLFSDTLSGAANWDEIRVGAVVGGGWEAIIAPGLKAAVEYLYKDYGKDSQTVGLVRSCTFGTCQAAAGSSAPIDTRLASHSVRVKLGWDLR